MNKLEDLKYQLETLASYEPSDIDYPEFDVAYEHGDGLDGFISVCCVDLAATSLKRIQHLESALSDLIDVASWCDNWESFPSDDLDEAISILEGVEL